MWIENRLIRVSCVCGEALVVDVCGCRVTEVVFGCECNVSLALETWI